MADFHFDKAIEKFRYRGSFYVLTNEYEKETYLKILTIGEKSYLIRGMEKGTTIPEELKTAIITNKGTLDYHSHPFIGDLVPSQEDKDFLKLLTWQKESVIIDPEQSAVYFTVYGTKEKFKLDTEHTDDYWLELFGEGD